MTVRVRDAVPADRQAIAAFTQDTFAWGDYVVEAFDRWLADPDGKLYVAVDDHDVAIAMSRGALLSPTEAWFQGARVHPDWRRQGIASRLDAALEDWARDRAARVVRLCVEEGNSAAAAQVEAIGLRRVAGFAHATRPVRRPPSTAGNGSRRRRRPQRLSPATSAEAEPALMSWSAGDLARSSHELFAVRWSWRRLTLADLVAAGRSGALWQSPSGWALAAVDNDALEVGWLETGPDEAADLLAALVPLAAEQGADRVAAMLPDAGWLVTAAASLGYDPRPFSIYAKAI